MIHESGESLDWDQVLNKAEAYKLLIATQLVLPVLAEDWQIAIPEDVLMKVSQMTPTPEEQDMVGRLMVEGRPAAQRLLDDLTGIGDWRKRASFLRVNLLPSAAYMDERYGIPNDAVRPLYYPYRWFKGLAELFRGSDSSYASTDDASDI
ncbi:MAG: hypothetical protein R3C44_04775 [Chloroflexota bacterium]